MASLSRTAKCVVSIIAATCAVVILAPRDGFAQANITGTWSGSYTLSTHCDNGSSLASSGNAFAIFTQTGAAFSGVLVFDSFQVPDPSTCTLFGTYPIGLPIDGTVSGNSITANLTTIFGGMSPLSGTVSGTSLSATISGAEASGTLTLTQTSTQPPAGAGVTYAGTYDATEDVSRLCSNMPTIHYSGPATVQTTDFGGHFYASAFLSNAKAVQSNYGTCSVIDTSDVTVTVNGSRSGDTVSGTAVAGELSLPFTGTVTAQNFSGTASDGSNTFTITATASSSSAPAVTAFVATPATIRAGASSILSWATGGATGVTIDNGIGARPASGSVTVTPSATTTYILTATGPGGSATASVTVTVAAAAPRVNVSSSPAGMVQVAGLGGATDSFTLTNSGGIDTTVSLSTASTFFTLSASSVPLRAGASQIVTVTGKPEAAGAYDGTVAISGSGVAPSTSVRIRLLSAPAPTGTVRPRASSLRPEVNAPAGQNPSGTVQFTNAGTGTLLGIAVSDAPWLIPDTNLFSVPPGQTRPISFHVDRSLRRDAAAPAGGANSKFSIRYLSGTSGKMAPNAEPAGGTSTVSVTVVDVVTPGLTAGAPPALSTGEVAFFIPGITQTSTVAGDVSMSARAPLSNIRVYLGGSGVSPKFATVGSIASDTAVEYQSVLKNAFGLTSQTATLQVRGATVDTAAIAGTQINKSATDATYGWQLPLFRSDRGFAPGVISTLTGVVKNASARTDLFIQEVAGADARVQIDMLDAQGALVGSRPADSIAAFGLLNLSDVVPANVTAVRVTNTSTNGARVMAYGSVVDATTGDSWPVLDWPGYLGAASSATKFVPVPATATPAATDLYLTNTRTSPATVTLAFVPASGRGRAIRRPTGAEGKISTSAATISRSYTIAAGQTLVLADALSKTFGAASGSGGSISVQGDVSATARTLMTAPGRAGTFGTVLPVLPQGTGLSTGATLRFAGIDDASDATVSAATPATYRSNLGLLETAGQPATVRVVLGYSFSAGLTASAFAESSRDFVLAPNQFVYVRDLAASVIGPPRATFGDLRGMQIDVTVVGGSGRVVPFVTEVESASGDVMLRTE